MTTIEIGMTMVMHKMIVHPTVKRKYLNSAETIQKSVSHVCPETKRKHFLESPEIPWIAFVLRLHGHIKNRTTVAVPKSLKEKSF